jgi:AraC-like DNA-binding protein
MSFDICVPGPPLSRYVTVLWHCEEYVAPHTFERVLPSGTLQLLLPLTDEPLRAYDNQYIGRYESFRGPLVCGARSEFAVVDSTSQGSMMGVQFKAGGALPLLTFRVGELHNQYLSLDAAWGKRAGELHHRLLEARSAKARFQILEAELLQRLYEAAEQPASIRYALAAFDVAPHDRAIGDVCEAVGLSARRFIEVFSDHVGLTPKRYCRVRRFQAALRLMAGQTEVDWAQVALACGYFDQAHFNRDFRAFAGVTPTTYLVQRSGHPNHLQLSD